MSRYVCADVSFREEDYTIVAIRREDMLPIMEWRNAQLEVLRQKEPLTETQQLAYWENVVAPGFAQPQPTQILLSYLHRDRAIGYGGFVHISWPDRRAEISFLVDPDRATRAEVYARDFTVWLALVRRLAFERLGFQRLCTETYVTRVEHINLLESAGFEREGRLRHHVIIHGRPVDSLMHGCLNPNSLSLS
jgi:RimJ/RimL family protein N-acetyltransferase